METQLMVRGRAMVNLRRAVNNCMGHSSQVRARPGVKSIRLCGAVYSRLIFQKSEETAKDFGKFAGNCREKRAGEIAAMPNY
jgi:hypothetical protein